MDHVTLTQRLAAHGWDWPAPVLLDSTPSTNADVGRAARAGAAEGSVVCAELQTAGRGRLGRSWSSPTGAGLTFSLLLRPAVADADWGWLPLLAGVAVAGALQDTTGVPVALKWPNDLVVAGPDRSGGAGPRKLGGILMERVTDGPRPAAVVGVGIDVLHDAADLPVPTATSLALEGAGALDRETVLAAVLSALRGWYRRWTDAGGDSVRSGLADAYRERCLTLGSRVRVESAGGPPLVGRAVDVDRLGRLLVEPVGGGAVEAVAAGDVVHLRADGS